MSGLRSLAIVVMIAAMATPVLAQGLLSGSADLEAASKVRDYYENWLTSIPGVASVTVANSDQGKPQIVVNVNQMTPQIKTIPAELNGIPVVVAKPPPIGQEPLPTPFVLLTPEATP